MASTRKLVASFSGGEVSPLMLSRFDDGRAAQGLRLCRNAITWPQGAAKRRPGMALVREVKDSSKRTRVIPFSYGAGQELAIELGEGYFRFHADGATLLYIDGIPVASVDDAANQITFTRPHGLAADELIRFLPGPGGVLPTGTAAAGYYTRLVDAYTIEISAMSGGAAVNITTTGTLPFYCYRLADQPPTYISSRAFLSVSTGGDAITTNGAHNLTTGDPIEFTLSGGVLPEYEPSGSIISYPLLEGVVYYAIVTGPSVIQVATTRQNALDGVELNLTSAGSGAPIVHYYYTPGQRVTHASPDGYFRCIQAGPKLNVPGATSYWEQMPSDGVLEAKNSYAEADLFDIHYAQSGDVLTLVHRNYPPSDLSRLSATEWKFEAIDFTPPLVAPVSASVSPVAGLTHDVVTITAATPGLITTDNEHGLVLNDPVYASSIPGITDGFYAVRSVPAAAQVTLKTLDGGADVTSSSATPGGKIRYASASSEITNFYRVTAIDSSGGESDGSNAAGATNNLLTEGSYNTITWAPVVGATRYRVYKAQTGLYGYIGETVELTFKDDNIAPDLGRTLPRFDTTLATLTTQYPGAVGYFEGRRVFGGTTASPRSMWWSRTGFPSDLSYHIPVQDDDRIQRDIDARQAVTIRHIVPMTQLLLLTDTAEFRVSPLNTDTITPASISVRPQTYVGGSMVQPVVINGTVVFAAARGGHVREVGYKQNEGYLNGDLSIRATHLFDGLTVVDMAYQKAPIPIVWCPSSDGRLLGITYTPEEGVGGWHQHTTDGVVESVCCVNDGGEEDSLYLVVKRTLDGTDYRFVERMAEQVQPEDAAGWRFLDACVTFDGTNTTSTTLTITRSATWAAGQTVTIAATGAMVFRTGDDDVGSYIRAAYNGSYYRFRITAVSTGLSATAAIVDAVPIATATTNFAAGTDWGWMRSTLTTPDHLEGVTLACIADGVVQPNKTPDGGLVSISAPALKVHLGIGYDTDMQMLPIAVQFQALAQGRTMSVTEAWVRYWRSGEFEVGIAEAGKEVGTYDWTRMETDQDQEDGLTRELQFPSGWNEDATIWIRQTQPLPLTVVSATIKVSIGT